MGASSFRAGRGSRIRSGGYSGAYSLKRKTIYTIALVSGFLSALIAAIVMGWV